MLFTPEKILLQPVLKTENGVVYTKIPSDTFEKAYIQLRKKEGWFYTGEKLKQLPDVPKYDSQYAFWQIRKKSSDWLIKYVQQKKNINYLLDVGCGNGWLTNKLAEVIPDAHVVGADINATELQLAAKNFSIKNITWLYGDVLQNLFQENTFDIIVLSASIQYFPDVPILLHTLLRYLTPCGEIHILDSPFYTKQEAENAAARSAVYYLKAGAPDMQNYYHHHTTESLRGYQIEILYKPGIFKMRMRKIFRYAYVPFYWIVVRR